MAPSVLSSSAALDQIPSKQFRGARTADTDKEDTLGDLAFSVAKVMKQAVQIAIGRLQCRFSCSCSYVNSIVFAVIEFTYNCS